MIAAAITMTLTDGAVAQSACLTYEPDTVQVTGVLEIRGFPGPPDYVEGDPEEEAIILVLLEPVCVEGRPQSELNQGSEENVREIQLAFPLEHVGDGRALTGRRVRASGVLWHAHTAHHRTRVLMAPSAVLPAQDRPGPVVIPRYDGPLSPEERNQIRGMDYDPSDTPLAWLPDRKLLIAHDEQYSNADVYSGTCAGSGFYWVPVNGGAADPIATGRPACEALSSWNLIAASPDARIVYYDVITPPNNLRLARLDLRSTTVDTLDAGCVNLEEPAVAPDGTRLAAAGQCVDRDQRWGIYLLGLENAEPRRLTDTTRSYSSPAWSPDGTQLVFNAGGGAEVERTMVVGDTAGHVRSLGKAGFQLAWSPDGEWIAFIAEAPAGDHLEIRIVRPNGEDERVVFRNSVQTTYSRGWGPYPEGETIGPLVWSPDSRAIAFSRRFDAGTSVWRVDLETGEVIPVTTQDP